MPKQAARCCSLPNRGGLFNATERSGSAGGMAARSAEGERRGPAAARRRILRNIKTGRPAAPAVALAGDGKFKRPVTEGLEPGAETAPPRRRPVEERGRGAAGSAINENGITGGIHAREPDGRGLALRH